MFLRGMLFHDQQKAPGTHTSQNHGHSVGATLPVFCLARLLVHRVPGGVCQTSPSLRAEGDMLEDRKKAATVPSQVTKLGHVSHSTTFLPDNHPFTTPSWGHFFARVFELSAWRIEVRASKNNIYCMFQKNRTFTSIPQDLKSWVFV